MGDWPLRLRHIYTKAYPPEGDGGAEPLGSSKRASGLHLHREMYPVPKGRTLPRDDQVREARTSPTRCAHVCSARNRSRPAAAIARRSPSSARSRAIAGAISVSVR